MGMRVEQRASTDVSLRAAASAFLIVAAWLHFLYSPEHFREFFLHGLFLAVVGVFQLAGGLALFRRLPRVALVAGAAGSIAVAMVWVAAVTTGVPIGPHPMMPEEISAAGILSTALEVATSAILLRLAKENFG